MRPGLRVALLSILLLLAASVPVVASVPGAAGPAGDQGERHALQGGSQRHALQEASQRHALQEESPVAPTSVNLTVELQGDGSARWTVETAFRLETAQDERAFDRLAESFRDGQADATYDVGTFRRASASASEATGREMQITGVDRSVDREPRANYTVGYLRTSFTWTNFSRVNDSWLVVGDAFNTTDGTWLPGLAADQRLVVRPPPGYAVYDAPIPIQQAQFVWQGPTTFEPGYLSMTFRYTGRNGTPSPQGPFDPATLGLLAAIVVALGALALGGYAWARRDKLPGGPVGADDVPDSSGSVADGGADAAVADETGESAEDGEGADLDLLSDEERVEHLLEENGGRMKQATIVKETGWSNAKVSQLLSAMDEDDRVDKLRIGRENLISLPDEGIGEFDE